MLDLAKDPWPPLGSPANQQAIDPVASSTARAFSARISPLAKPGSTPPA
jgi:hypothetical protein